MCRPDTHALLHPTSRPPLPQFQTEPFNDPPIPSHHQTLMQTQFGKVASIEIAFSRVYRQRHDGNLFENCLAPVSPKYYFKKMGMIPLTIFIDNILFIMIKVSRY